MKIIAAVAFVFAWAALAWGGIQSPVPLWPGGAPDALGTSSNDIPAVTPYVPEVTNATHTAMVICPGGAYGYLEQKEGTDYALWLNQHGVTCFVLKYRLGSNGYRYPAMLNDAARAMRWVRAHAADYNLNLHHVGIMGSSAGGHLAAMLMTHCDMGDPKAADMVERQSSRPNFGVLCYPVITMIGEFANVSSRNNLLGSNAPTRLAREVSPELDVTAVTPVCFLWTTTSDTGVPMENTMLFAGALRKNNVRFELHVYERGSHGMGLGDSPPFNHPHPWTGALLFWLKEHRWAN